MADSYLRLGLYWSRLDGGQAQATGYFQQALGLLRLIYGVCQHPDVAKAVYHLAVVTYDAGQWADAMQLFEECRPMLLKAYGPQDALVAATEDYLRGAPADETPRPAPSAASRPRSAAVSQGGRSEANLADLVALNRFEEAVPLCDARIAAQQERFGEDSVEHAAALMQQGHNYAQLEWFPQAVAAFEAARAATAAAFDDEGHLYVADCLQLKSDALASAGEYAEAAAEYERALAIWEAQLEGKTETLCDAYERLAQLHFRFGKMAKSLQVWRKLLEMHSTKSWHWCMPN